MRASDLITAEVVSVGPGCSLRKAARLLIGHRIGSLPVVDDDGRILGVVSIAELTPRRKLVPFSTERLLALLGEFVDTGGLAAAYHDAGERRVQDVMQPAHWIDADADLGAVVDALGNRRGALFAVRGGRLLGVITRTDLLRLLAEEDRHAA
jgi:CBS domain-containing protein